MSHKVLRPIVSLFLALVIALGGSGSALAAVGSLDPTFGTGGLVTTDFDKRGDFGYAVALQRDGKIIVAGQSSDYSGSCCDHDFALARYNRDGSLDTGFDADGQVITGFGSTSFGNTHESISSVAIQSNGKIIAAGGSTTFSSSGGNTNFALARYNSDGSLDTTFDTDGKVTTDFGTIYDQAFSVAIQSDGKIVASGGSYLKLALARYNSNGSLDTTFDTDGKVLLDFGSGENYGGTLALQPDGKIVLAGQTWVSQVGYVFAVARFNSNGSLDTTFDADGKVTTDFANSFDDAITDVAVQQNGKIIVAGGSDVDQGADSNFALARYNSDGSLDTTFDIDGKVITDFGSLEDIARAVAIQPDGRIVAAGRSRVGGSADFALARYNSDGSLDRTFDTDGKVTTAIGSGEAYGYAIALQRDGKIIVAGASDLLVGNEYDFALARYDAVNSSTFKSVGWQDGWILESTETSSIGGTMNSAATTFNLGDDIANKQYRALLSFNTSSLPNDAIITKMILKVKKNGVKGGGNPVNMFQGFRVDIRKGTFGAHVLELGDFQALAIKTYGPFNPPLSSTGWYSINLTSAKGYINMTGTTQIRLRFNLDDNNNNVANFLKLYSGNAVVTSDSPRLIINYYTP